MLGCRGPRERNEFLAFHTDRRFNSFASIEALQTWADTWAWSAADGSRPRGCIWGSLVGELANTDELVRSECVHGYDAWLTLFRGGLSEMQNRGELREDADPRHLAIALVCAHQGSMALSQTVGEADAVRIALNAAVDYVRLFMV